MAVAEATHLELKAWLQPNRVHLIVAVDEVIFEPLRPTCPAATRRDTDTLHRLGARAVGAGEHPDFVPPTAVARLVDVEVGRDRWKVDRGPQPEELWFTDRRAGGPGALASGTDSPRAVARSPHGGRRHIETLPVDLDPTLPATRTG